MQTAGQPRDYMQFCRHYIGPALHAVLPAGPQADRQAHRQGRASRRAAAGAGSQAHHPRRL